MNVELLRQVQQQILAEPEHVNIGEWGKAAACGTVGCIAGHACFLGDHWDIKKSLYDMDIDQRIGISSRGQSLLKLTAQQASDLFLPGYWPYKWKKRLTRTNPGTKAHAQVISDYIDYFIEKYAPKEVAQPVKHETPAEWKLKGQKPEQGHVQQS